MDVPMFINCKMTLVLFLLFLFVGHVRMCRISEFYCDNGECIGLDKFCDGNRDCQDGSDETRYCSRCNRTYYGDRYKTYHLDVTKPSPGKLPYICALTFMAGGGDLGDIVELSFERFHIGRLDISPNGNSAVCTGSSMQILESNMSPETSGRWCGLAKSIPVYYSEAKNVTVLLTVSFVDNDEYHHQNMPFQFALKFRYLSKSDAVTRYGQNYAQYHRGEWIPTSVCDRIFQDCDSQLCKIHSPNFPGVYPLNVTCLFHVTQRTIPRGKHAFIVLKQRNEDKLSIKAGFGGNRLFPATSRDITFRPEKKLLFGSDCVHDSVKVYDGSDTRSSLLATFCHSGSLSPVISSGPEVVIEFHTSSVDFLEVHSFELDVEVMFIPESDVGLRMLSQRCEWMIVADEHRSGVIHSLRHLAAPNTTCSYTFRGRRQDVIWLYFVKYFVDGKGGTDRSFRETTIEGELFDGNPTHMATSYHRTNNSTLLTTFDDDRGVRLCVHARTFPNFVPLRPCRYPTESYLSSGPEMFLRYTFSRRFNLHYLQMEGRYEFIDTYQDGDPLNAESSSIMSDCRRLFHSRRRPEGTFASPRNLFMYGRGGHPNLKCSYTFVGLETETVRLTFRKLRMGNRKCETTYDISSRRHTCSHHGITNSIVGGSAGGGLSIGRDPKEPLAEIRVSRVLFGRVEVPVACICHLDNPLTIDVMSNVVHVNYTVTDMTSLEDFDSFYFEASYEFLSSVHCKVSDYVLDGADGEVAITASRSDLVRDGPTQTKCPWLLPADFNHFVHLSIQGVAMTETCDTKNRIVVFVADELEPVMVVCPMIRTPDSGIPAAAVSGSLGVGYGISNDGGDTSGGSSSSNAVGGNGILGGSAGIGEVEVYTRSWNRTVLPTRPHSNTLIVEFHAIEPGRFYFKWTRGIKSHADRLLGRRSRSEECATRCLDHENCPTPLFWCDKKPDCSGTDDCTSSFAKFPWIYVGIGVGCGLLVTMVLFVSLMHRRRETKAKKGKPVPTDEYAMDGKEIDC